MAREKGIGSERAQRHTRLRAWPDLGRPGRGSPAVGSRTAVGGTGSSAPARGTAQGGGGLASGGLGAATYREEKIREGRQAEVHGGGIMAVLSSASCAWQHRSGRGNQRIGLGIG
jgi:hypothetical protein